MPVRKVRLYFLRVRFVCYFLAFDPFTAPCDTSYISGSRAPTSDSSFRFRSWLHLRQVLRQRVLFPHVGHLPFTCLFGHQLWRITVLSAGMSGRKRTHILHAAPVYQHIRHSRIDGHLAIVQAPPAATSHRGRVGVLVVLMLREWAGGGLTASRKLWRPHRRIPCGVSSRRRPGWTRSRSRARPCRRSCRTFLGQSSLRTGFGLCLLFSARGQPQLARSARLAQACC